MLQAFGITRKIKTVDSVLANFEDALIDLQDVAETNSQMSLDKEKQAEALIEEANSHKAEAKRAAFVVGKFESLLGKSPK